MAVFKDCHQTSPRVLLKRCLSEKIVIKVVVWWCFRGVLVCFVVVFFWWCSCGGVFVVVRWCGGVWVISEKVWQGAWLQIITLS